MSTATAPVATANSPFRVLMASLSGTTIEFFDFYIYANAAVLVFPILFFPHSEGATAILQSLATFALAFFARPFGAALFGHFGDRVGRKVTLVAALLTMGISTVVIGLLPSYAQIGIWAPIMLAVCRFGQGLGLGGEWGGAVLLATENAPAGKRAWYGMFPQLGAPLGFVLAGSSFLLLAHFLTDEEFLQWGWRIPFLASAALVLVGLYVRLKIEETPVFKATLDKQQQERMPIAAVCKKHPRMLVLGTLAGVSTFVLFYLTSVFSLTWGTSKLGYSREQFLTMQLMGVIMFALWVPISALFADKHGRRITMISISLAIAVFGLFLEPLFNHSYASMLVFLGVGFALMGYTYGPLGTMLAELFPAEMRYTGASLAFNFAGILGASIAPYLAMWLASTYSLAAVGWYLSAAGLISAMAIWGLAETRHHKF